MPFRTDRNQTTHIETTPRFELSLRQMVASTGAAVTAAVLGSRLGVAGTLIGAALASIVTMGAAAIYSHSLAKAQYKVRQALTAGQAAAAAAAEAPTTVIPLAAQAWGDLPATALPATALPTTSARSAPRPRRQWLWAGVGALATSIIALGAITGFEAVRGTPISGGDQGGLSVLGGAPAPAAAPRTTDSPTDSTSTTSGSSIPGSTSSSADPATSEPSATSPGTSTKPTTNPPTNPPTTVTATVTQTVLPPVGSAATTSSAAGPAGSSAADPLAGSSSTTTTTPARPGGK